MLDNLPLTLQNKIYPEPNSGCWLWGGAINSAGYGSLNKEKYGEHTIHRLVYRCFYGKLLPSENLDHICHTRACVNPDHLRKASDLENARNKKAFSGLKQKGISLRNGRWRAYITLNYKQHHLGSFDTREQAMMVYDQAALEMHKDFACTNAMLGLVSDERRSAPLRDNVTAAE